MPERSDVSRPRWSRRQILAAVAAASLASRIPAAHAAAVPGLPILSYHRFDPEAAAPYTVSAKAFEAQLVWLGAHDFGVIRLHDAVAALQTPGGSNARQAAITVDDGHRSAYTVLFPLIRKHRVPVTLFIYPSAISNASYAITWEQLHEMQASGFVDVQSHTYWHPNFHIERKRRSPADYRAFVDDQLRRSRQVLEARLKTPVDLLAWPFGIVDSELEAAAQQAGYAAAFGYPGGVAPPGGDRFAVPRIAVSDADRGERFAVLLGDKR